MIYIIGCGGVGSWLAPALCLLAKPINVTLVDGDTLEHKNLNRQLFDESHIGMNKAVALGEKYGCQSNDHWYSPTLMPHEPEDWLFGLVDNHPARRSVLQCCDMYGCKAIFAANETHSSEAYVYLPEWRGTCRDPRTYYPEIQTDNSDDPRNAAIGCTGEAQVGNPQLVTANFMAAALAGHMYVVWALEAPKLDAGVRPFLPYKLVNNLTANETHKVGELTGETKHE
jgi:hypothetical protein